jgi:ferredoxin
MKVQIDQEKCCSSGMCALNVPEIFDQRDEDGVGVVLEPSPPDQFQDAVRHAAALCPSGAIVVQDD